MSEAHVKQVREQDLVLSGGFGTSSNSARAGYLPVALEHLPLESLSGVGVYIRVRSTSPSLTAGVAPPSGHDTTFRLYCADKVHFTEMHRRRLLEHGVRFVYIRMADQQRFREQNEKCIARMAADPASAISQTSSLIYETSVELINELLAEPELMARSPRLEQISRAVTTVVINNPNAFSHLFAASHHDFYTATHMVNVATWMVPLAYEMGIRNPDELNLVCQAGILHDMGKVGIPSDVLNKSGKLSNDEWAQIRAHPQAGHDYLSRFSGVNPVVLRVALEHHERMDGSGYPNRIAGDHMHLFSRICAVVDSFDAMTAFRPFKERTLSVTEAMGILRRETPGKYDPEVMKAWTRMVVKATEPSQTLGPDIGGGNNLRRHPRTTFHCPARAHQLETAGHAELPGFPVTAHSISRGGVGILSQLAIEPGEVVRVYLQAKGWEDRGLDGEVVRCRVYNDRWHEIGIKFTELKQQAAA
jgi:HD-GYP domain-containing protein (c-di-GMP phosphodiesterase class II)